MRNALNKSALLAFTLVAAASAAAQEAPLRSELEQALGRPTKAPIVPPELQQFIREASRERLVVRTSRGEDIVIDIAEREAEDLVQFGGGRFVGFSYTGYEFFGFTLIDRAARGEATLVDTGARPVFSSDGRYFASAVITEEGYGDSEGLSVWEVLPDRVVRRFYTDVAPRGFDWRVDGWPRPDCVAISAIEFAWQPPAGVDYGEAARTAPRMQFQIELGEEEVTVRTSVAGSVCGVVTAE